MTKLRRTGLKPSFKRDSNCVCNEVPKCRSDQRSRSESALMDGQQFGMCHGQEGCNIFIKLSQIANKWIGAWHGSGKQSGLLAPDESPVNNTVNCQPGKQHGITEIKTRRGGSLLYVGLWGMKMS
uniref:HDC11537 n=1 Tax=Drosophila melanogaster TaxID=7227 RepID=Q6IKS7_DROME|nr:TPA_inf: HDC11537 [Drosophila melanogaster]